eukprot:SAG31_NODE_1664_length_7585_cov_10.994523_7_plen_256_part_00
MEAQITQATAHRSKWPCIPHSSPCIPHSSPCIPHSFPNNPTCAPRFLYKGMSEAELQSKNITVPAWGLGGGMTIDPKSFSALKIAPLCPNPTTNATICDPALRTLNVNAECGSREDIYYWSPWRAPGTAPVIDACGSAGGRHPGQGLGVAGASFQNSSVAFEGMAGSQLPAGPAQATWKRGAQVQVGWAISAHHGGGYQYRLAPVGQPISEKLFQRMPLHAVGPGILRWDGNTSTDLQFNATRVYAGVVPVCPNA